jgi:uncharacterized membrane protein YphA (DoxX/SURF4 family)
LFLLRAVVGCSLIVHGASYFNGWQNLQFTGGTIGILTAAAGVSLLAGFMTPVVSVIVILGGLARVFSLLPPPSASNINSLLTNLNIVILAAALAFLGPGAFSFDARIFGRREIKIPSFSEHKT